MLVGGGESVEEGVKPDTEADAERLVVKDKVLEGDSESVPDAEVDPETVTEAVGCNDHVSVSERDRVLVRVIDLERDGVLEIDLEVVTVLVDDGEAVEEGVPTETDREVDKLLDAVNEVDRDKESVIVSDKVGIIESEAVIGKERVLVRVSVSLGVTVGTTVCEADTISVELKDKLSDIISERDAESAKEREKVVVNVIGSVTEATGDSLPVND